jgi:hypothetical protein
MTADYGQWMIGRSPTSDQCNSEDDMLFGRVDVPATNDITMISIPRGAAKEIGLMADNGLQDMGPATLRVAVHDKDGWHVTDGVVVDGAKAKTVVTFRDPASTDGVSVRRKVWGNVLIAWDAS